MASPPAGEGTSSTRLRFFLVFGVRALGLALALALTRAHSIEPFNPLPAGLGEMPGLLSGAVVLYHLAAGLLLLQVQGRAAVWLALALDLLTGFALTSYYGPAYLVLAFTLPALTVTHHYGPTGALGALTLGGLFYALVLVSALMTRMEAGPLAPQLELVGVELGATALLLWLYLLAVSEGADRAESEEGARKERDTLFREIQLAKSESAQLYGDLNSRETAIRQLERGLSKVSQEAEESRKRIHELKLSLEAAEKLAEEQGRESAQQARREKLQVQRQLARLQQRLERRERMIGLFGQVSSSLALSDTLLALTQGLQALLPSQTCVIFMLDEVDGHRELFAEVAASPHTDQFRNFSMQVGEGAPGWALARRTALKIDQGAASVDGREVTTVLPDEQSALVAPLHVGDQDLGVVYLGRPQAAEFSAEDLDLLRDFSDLASLALSNAIRYQGAVSSGIQDPLTQLYNGLFLEERMKEEVRRGRRYTYPVSLLLLELDHFLEIQEAHGPELSESVLKESAELIRAQVRETDVVARLEGCEFALLLVHLDRAAAFEVAERVRAALGERTFGRGVRKIRLTASLGVAGIPHDAVNEEQLTLRATAALQQALGLGGNVTCLWSQREA